MGLLSMNCTVASRSVSARFNAAIICSLLIFRLLPLRAPLPRSAAARAPCRSAACVPVRSAGFPASSPAPSAACVVLAVSFALHDGPQHTGQCLDLLLWGGVSH